VIRRSARTLGIGLSHDTVRAVVTECGRIVWANETPVDDEQLGAAVRDLVAEARRDHGARGAVVVAVGPMRAQLRQLHGLPAVRDASTLAAIVQQNAGRYFRQNGVPMITTPIAELSGDEGWAGAIESTVVDAIADVGRELRLPSISIAPVAALLGHAAPDSALAWHDGDVAMELRYEGDRLVESRSTPASLLTRAHGDGASFASPLSDLGDDALRYADAYAAARGGNANRLAVHPSGERRRRDVRRLATTGAAFVVALGFAALAPTFAAMRVQRSASARLARLSSATAPVQGVERAVADSARLLAKLVAFHRTAASRTLLLATLSCAVEEPAMLLSLRLEPSGGTLTALAPSAAELLAMLDEIPEIAAPAIVGSVTPESRPTAPAMPTPGAAPSNTASPATTDRPLERVTVRFAWRAGVKPSTHPVGCDE
jgi:hypothetical protein